MRFSATPRPPAAVARALAGLIAAVLMTGGAALLSGCASSSGTAPAGDAAPRDGRAVARSLRAETRSWEGTPYRMGGTTRRGVDCSAFVQHLYDAALGTALTRSTRTQVQEGRRVSKRALRPGDLVFFRPGYKTRHVGVYVGEGEFAHASSSQGVTISPLESDYWQDAYWTARRILPVQRVQPAPPVAETARSPAASSEAAPSHRESGARTGW